MPKPVPNVWLIDDCPLARKLCLLRLKEAGGTPCGFAGTSAALATLAREKPALVIVDMQLQGESGLQAAERLRHAGYFGVLVIMTGSPELVDRKAAAVLKVAAVMRKPPQAHVLAALLSPLTRIAGDHAA